MKTICIKSPLAGDFEKNRRYAQACMFFCLHRGTAPFASHLLYPQVLDDQNKEHRLMGMKAGMTIGDRCDERWIFTDLGVSSGMRAAITRAERKGQIVRYMELGPEWMHIRTVPTQAFSPTDHEETAPDCEPCEEKKPQRKTVETLGIDPNTKVEVKS